MTRKKQPAKSSKSQPVTKDNSCLQMPSSPLSWSVGDKQAMIERRRIKLAQTGVDVCMNCGGCLWRLDGRVICGDGCLRQKNHKHFASFIAL